MSKWRGTQHSVEQRTGLDVGRRNLLKLTGASIAALSAMSVANAPVSAQDILAWDKTFPKTDWVSHQKVSFYNRLGIDLVADLYVPRNLDRSRPAPAIVW